MAIDNLSICIVRIAIFVHYELNSTTRDLSIEVANLVSILYIEQRLNQNTKKFISKLSASK